MAKVMDKVEKSQIYNTVLRMRKDLHPDVWKLKITKC